MKKLIVILLSVLLFSCVEDEIPDDRGCVVFTGLDEFQFYRNVTMNGDQLSLTDMNGILSTISYTKVTAYHCDVILPK